MDRRRQTAGGILSSSWFRRSAAYAVTAQHGVRRPRSWKTPSIAFLLISLLWAPVHASEPTLARLSFWVPSERMAEFETLYDQKVVPLLKRRGFVPSAQIGRATVDGVFSRLFEFDTPSGVSGKAKILREDPDLTGVLKQLGDTFGTTSPEGLIRHRFSIYRAPAGAGKVVAAGPGKTVATGPGKKHWRSYTATHELDPGIVPSILEDRNGNLWFGGSKGVIRFDGQTIKRFTAEGGQAHENVWYLLEDRQGNIWASGKNGVGRFDGQKWTDLTTEAGLADKEGRGILQDREGNIWIGTTGGVSRFDGRTPAKNVPGQAPDQSQGQAWTHFTTKDGLAHNLFVWSILQDREGSLWFGTQGGGVSRYDGRTWNTFTTASGLATNYVMGLHQDTKGDIWVGSYDLFGSSSPHVSKYDGKTWTTFYIPGSPEFNQVWSILQDRADQTWLATGFGLHRYDGSRWTAYTTEDGLLGNETGSIAQDREGHYWIGTSKGLSQYDDRTWTTYTEKDGLAQNNVKSMLRDQQGLFWFSYRERSVSKFDGRNWTTFTQEDGLVPNFTNSIVQDRRGHLWFGTEGGGVTRYDGQTWTTFTTEDGLPSNDVICILEDREGNLWFGTRGGATRYDGQTPDQSPLRRSSGQAGQAWTTFTTEDGLGNNLVNSILQDLEGNLWFGTQIGGVTRYSRSADASQKDSGPAKESWTTFTLGKGPFANYVYSAFQDRDGVLWFGTFPGVSRYDPSPGPASPRQARTEPSRTARDTAQDRPKGIGPT